MEMYNTSGVRVALLKHNTESAKETTAFVDVARLNLSPGVYFVVIKTKAGSVAKKVEIFR
jgi:hypothetical protein